MKQYLVKKINGESTNVILENVNDASDILLWNNGIKYLEFNVNDIIENVEINIKGNVDVMRSKPTLVTTSKEFNVCSDLQVNIEKSDDFDFIFNLQKTIQESTYGYDFSAMTLNEVTQFWLMNKHALTDELHEMFDALGGMHDGIANAVWKPWKVKNKLTHNMKVSTLSDRDNKELKFEIVDAFHFMINFAVSIGMSGSELFSMYKSKNKENINRQKNNY